MVSASKIRVRSKKLTYVLSNGESGKKRKESEGFHDCDGRERGAAVKERLSLFVL
jgi:hypothetical protein